MNITNQHMNDHVRDLQTHFKAIFKPGALSSCSELGMLMRESYNGIDTLSQHDRNSLTASYIQDLNSIYDCLNSEDFSLVESCIVGECSREELYKAVWKCSKINITEAYEEALESIVQEHSESNPRRATNRMASLLTSWRSKRITGVIA